MKNKAISLGKNVIFNHYFKEIFLTLTGGVVDLNI